MYYDLEVTAEDEEKLIEQIAKKIHDYGMDTAAILFLESSKPLVWIGGEMGRFFITPFVPIISEEWGKKSEKFFLTFEKRGNIEKLLQRLEQLTREDEQKKKEEKESKKLTKIESDKKPETEPTEEPGKEKKGWRRYVPF